MPGKDLGKKKEIENLGFILDDFMSKVIIGWIYFSDDRERSL